MGSPIVVDTCICTGHGCWPPRPNSGKSDKFRVGGLGVVRVGDGWQAHTCPSIPETHSSVQASGSGKFRVGGQSVARIGDGIACGSSNATGVSKFRVA